MESMIDAMSGEYEEFVAAAAEVVKAKEASGGQRTAATDEALEKFRQRWGLFKASCDRAEEVLDSARRRVAAERVMDVASGAAAAQPGTGGLPPISVPRLERALHSINSLAEDLRHGSGAPAVASPSSPSGVTPSVDKSD